MTDARTSRMAKPSFGGWPLYFWIIQGMCLTVTVLVGVLAVTR